VQSQFEGLLIHRRKRYPTALRGTLSHAYELRRTADYDREQVSQIDALRTLRRTRSFIETIRSSIHYEG
jgi:hypothetical protein